MYSASQSVARMKDAHFFQRTRARLQRCTDQKFFSGWVRDIGVDTAAIRLNGDIADVQPGDRFSVEATGKEKTAVFIGDAVALVDDLLTMTLPHGVATVPKIESTRIRMLGYQGMLTVEGASAPFTLVDVSESGMGLYTKIEVPVGAELEYEVEAPKGILTGRGQSRHCTAEVGPPEQYRVGVAIEHASRIERAKWCLLLTKVWEG